MSVATQLEAGPLLLAGAAGPDVAEVCLRRLAAGDQAAAGELYDRFARELYGLALWRCGSSADAADVVQTVFVRLLERRRRLPAVRRPRAYLLRMTHRAAIDLLRRRGRRSEPLREELLAPVATDPARRLEAERMSRRLAELPPAQREALYLRYFAELSYAEIGRVTGVPTFTAASRCRLALRRLRRAAAGGGSP